MKHHRRIAALQCNFQTREQTLAMPEMWCELGFDMEQLFHTHADLYSAVYNPAPHGELLAEYQKRSEACAQELILYMNCHVLGPSLQIHQDDWCMRRQDGTPVMCYGTYPACCLNSGWRQYFFDCLARIPEVAGVFLDGPLEEMCYCPRCREQFRLTCGSEPEAATAASQRDFALQTKLRFQMEVYQCIKKNHPERIVYFNEGLFAGSGDAAYYRQLLDCNDWIATEGGFFFFGEPRLAAYWVCAKNAKLLEAVANGKPTVIFFAGDQKPWSWFLHTAAETELCYMAALANGASVWYGLHCAPEALNGAAGESLRKLLQFDRQHDAWYQHSESLAQVAIYYSFDTMAQSAGNGAAADFYGRGVKAVSSAALRSDYTMAIDGACALLEHLSEPYDFVTDLTPERLRRYRVILLPACSCLPPESEAALRQYLNDGGNIIADAEFAWGNLPEWAGFTRSGQFIEHHDCNYFAVDPEIYQVDNAFGWMPCPTWSCELETVEAEVIGRYAPVLPGRYAGRPEATVEPFFLRRRIGRGNFYYCAGNFYEFYFRYTHVCQREFVRALLLNHSRNPFRLHGGVEGISMTVRQSSSGILIHLLNYVGAVRPLHHSAPQRGLRLEAPPGYSARELTGNVVLSRDADGAWELPELREFMVIALYQEVAE